MGFLLALLLLGQNVSQRGFLEYRTTVYPQEAPQDASHAIGEALFRYEAAYNGGKAFQLAGSVDLRTDTHHQVEREANLSWLDRRLKRPLIAVRRLDATYRKGPVTLDVGKQFIRWGKTDVLTPTDRFAPRDFLAVVDNEFLAVTAARLTYSSGENSIEAVWVPWFTPSRIPLLNQRWAAVPEGISIREFSSTFPRGSQAGLRWNHVGRVEYSFSAYRGFNHLPLFDASPVPAPTGQIQVALRAFYPQMTMFGGDAAVPLRWVTLKSEVAHFSSNDPRTDEYLHYVIQLERQSGEWFFVGGYAGEVVTDPGSVNADFAPDRGLTHTLLGRAGLTIDANRSLALEAAVRQNGEGTWTKLEYSQALGQHWRITLVGTLIRGNPRDFLGQYRYNSQAGVVVRYSF